MSGPGILSHGGLLEVIVGPVVYLISQHHLTLVDAEGMSMLFEGIACRREDSWGAILAKLTLMWRLLRVDAAVDLLA